MLVDDVGGGCGTWLSCSVAVTSLFAAAARLTKENMVAMLGHHWIASRHYSLICPSARNSSSLSSLHHSKHGASGGKLPCRKEARGRRWYVMLTERMSDWFSMRNEKPEREEAGVVQSGVYVW
nr:hypothetical protein Iba_chr10fCG3940 [Ipomoea batatas]